MQRFKQSFFVIFVALISLFAISGLIKGDFFSVHDNTQVARVFEMHQSISDGMIPVRWVSDLGYGYGYPIFTFYAPLAYYIGAFFMLFGISALVATKIMMVLGFVLAGVAMYFLAKEFWGEQGGFVAGVLYGVAPYHGANLFIRGAIAEMWAYAFVPLAFYGVYKFTKVQNWQYFFVGVLGVAGVVVSHNLTAMMIIPLVGILAFALWIVGGRTKKSSLGFLVLLTGLLVSAFYWFPAFSQTDFTNVASQVTGGSQFKDHFVCPLQFWSSPVGFAGSGPGCIDGISFQLGKIHILLFLVSLLCSIIFFKKKKYLIPLICSQVIAVIGILLMLEVARPFWESVPFMKYFQFPWRFQALFLLGASFSAGALLQIQIPLFKKNQVIPLIFITLFCLFTLSMYHKFFLPQPYPSDAKMQTDKKYIRQKVSRISDEYMPKDFVRPEGGKYVVSSLQSSPNASVIVLEEKTQYIRAKFTAQQSGMYLTNIAYYPAWKVFIEHKKSPVMDKNGKLSFNLPEGESIIEFRYISTPYEVIGNLLSLAGIFLLTVGIISFRHRRKHEK